MIEKIVPPYDALSTEYNSLASLEQVIDAEITIYGSDKTLLGASSKAAELNLLPQEPGEWRSNFSQTEWATKLKDGRFVILVLDRPPLPALPVNLAIFLVLLSVLVSTLMYPFIRGVTGRLERLQKSVEKIGDGSLGARVKIEGRDEVASLARSFNRTADQIERLVESQRLLLAHASHELRTPLSRIRMGIEFLKKEDDPDRKTSIQNDIEELNSLIEELLTLSRLDAPNTDEELEDVDLLALAAIECANYDDCTLHGEHLPLVQGNGRLLQHVIRNLLDNAKHHGAPPICVSLEHEQDSVTLSVTDSGAGIPDHLKSDVFEPFRRGPDRQNTPGHGLGLALVRRIVDLHQGDIEIENTKASTIIVRLPQ
ncbi:MAG: HAMP domain-containing sensor histidine kinase [Pseudomonadota bacterium]